MTKTVRLAVCLVFFAVFAAGCTGRNIGEPSPVPQAQTAITATPADVPLPPRAPAEDPLPEPTGGRWTVRAEGGPTGPGCPGALPRTNTGTRFITYTIDVQNAGSDDWDVIAIGHYADEAGCNPTLRRPVPLEIRGKSDFRAGSTGTFQVIFDTWRIPCNGSAQPDAQAFTRQDRKAIQSMLFVAEVIQASPAPNCQPPPPPPPPPTPACDPATPPSQTVIFPIITGDVLSGQAQVKKDGTWAFYLYAGNTLSDYETDNPEFVKDSAILTQPCTGSGTLNVSYPWIGHSSRYWWVVLKRNGVVVFKSAVKIKP